MTGTAESPWADALREAVALHQALTNGDFDDALHRAKLIMTLAGTYGMDAVSDAAQAMLDPLRGALPGSTSNYMQAMERLALALDRALE